MKKIQSFYILKIDSSRLKESKYNIKDLSLNQARLNGEVVSLANSQMIRTIFKLKEKEFSQYELDAIWNERKKVSKKGSNRENKKKIKELNKKIDEMLYIPELISIHFEDKRHFYNIIDNGGFLVNGINYVPFLASAGMIRRDTYLFIDEKYAKPIRDIFDNGRDKTKEYVPAKFAAYYSLYSSSTIPVTFPKIAVVPDLIIKTVRTVDFSTYMGEGIDPKVEEVTKELECNAFDGQGLCSPSLAKKWAKDLDLDYVPSYFGVRCSYLKGMTAVFDFRRYADEIAQKESITDIYGNEININDVECIISESMFKLWDSYSNTDDYVSKCLENHIDWGITKVNNKNEKNHAKTSYQFLQVLNLTDEQIERLCKPTLSWIKDVSGDDVWKSLLFSLGEISFEKNWFENLDNTTKAILLDNSIINDSYIRSHLDKTIAKKKNDAKMGRLYFNGNYQCMISDPYAQAGHIFGMGVNPLLKEGEHFSKYWNDRKKSNVIAIRSPIVHSSEVNVLNLRNDNVVNDWYENIQSGVIFPAYGVSLDASILGGADFDLDLVCTIDSPEMIEGRVSGNPIFYDVKKPPKIILDDDSVTSVLNSQVRQIGTNKIGFYTNLSSAMYSLLGDLNDGTGEKNAILQRLKYGRILQGSTIDSAKGIDVDPFPEHFVKWVRIKDDMTDDEKEYHKFHNSIVANKRPLFMRWLYSGYNNRYLNELSKYDNISQTRWKISFDKLLKMEIKTTEQYDLIDKYRRKSFFISADSTMNRISKYVENQLKLISEEKRTKTREFDYMILLSKNFTKPNRRDIEKMKLLFKEWKSLNRSLRDHHAEYDDEMKYDSFEEINRYINEKAYSAISSNSQELADLAVFVCYNVFGVQSKSFAWKCFGKEIIETLKSKYDKKYVKVPMISEKGSEEYLWSKYGVYMLSVESL